MATAKTTLEISGLHIVWEKLRPQLTDKLRYNGASMAYLLDYLHTESKEENNAGCWTNFIANRFFHGNRLDARNAMKELERLGFVTKKKNSLNTYVWSLTGKTFEILKYKTGKIE